MHKGYAFVQFTNPFDARNACHGEDGRTVLSQVLGELYFYDNRENIFISIFFRFCLMALVNSCRTYESYIIIKIYHYWITYMIRSPHAWPIISKIVNIIIELDMRKQCLIFTDYLRYMRYIQWEHSHLFESIKIDYIIRIFVCWWFTILKYLFVFFLYVKQWCHKNFFIKELM